jgi:hypothetical protein
MATDARAQTDLVPLPLQESEAVCSIFNPDCFPVIPPSGPRTPSGPWPDGMIGPDGFMPLDQLLLGPQVPGDAQGWASPPPRLLPGS